MTGVRGFWAVVELNTEDGLFPRVAPKPDGFAAIGLAVFPNGVLVVPLVLLPNSDPPCGFDTVAGESDDEDDSAFGFDVVFGEGGGFVTFAKGEGCVLDDTEAGGEAPNDGAVSLDGSGVEVLLPDSFTSPKHSAGQASLYLLTNFVTSSRSRPLYFSSVAGIDGIFSGICLE
jgi:hypothetical protein